MHSLLVVLIVLGLFCGLVSAQAPAAGPVSATVTKDVIYGRAGGVALRLDASVPAGDGPHPAVILVHGGGWQGGDKSNFRALFEPLTQAGYAWFSVNYRLAPKFPFPACVDDVETAVQWVKAHAAEYNVDPDRIALLGESAGGHLVELVTARAGDKSPLRPAAVVALYAPSDLHALAKATQARGIPIAPMLRSLFGLDKWDAAAEGMLRAMSPVTHVRAGLPPFLLLHGTADQLVPIAQSTAFQAACQAVGVPCDLITVEGGPHGMMFWNLMDPSYKGKILAFLERQLKAKA
ncbi:MAG TPA: alpha/beta hydrolase [Tepidisphaeraceae bacterium]|jgi:alpha-L-fucosidase 2